VLDWAAEDKIPVQINTTVTGGNIHELAAMYQLLSEHHAPPVKRWSLFLLVPTGRAQMTDLPTAEQMEEVYAWLYRMGRDSPFHVGTVEAPMYRRYFVQQRLKQGDSWESLLAQASRYGLGIRDGNGVIFVSHRGRVLPSGFVPHTPLGNVKETPLHELYRSAPALQELRNMDHLHGKCGRCEFRWICGGSRARAAAVGGHMLAEEPLCAYEPSALV
jgi:radical SAM protein with 4Fe4S-binding SPASM domain